MKQSQGQSSVQRSSDSSSAADHDPISSSTESNFPMSEGRFRLAFENAPIGMAIVGLDYRIKRVNKALCSDLRYTEEELLGRTFIDITHPDDVYRDKELADQLFARQIPSYRIEKRFITKDANVVWGALTAILILEDEANPLYGLAMVENITERKRVHEALRASEERYRSFVVNSSEGIWRFEIEHPIDITLPPDEQVALFYKHAYLAECNDALAKMYGHQRAEDVLGLRFGNARLASNPVNLGSLRKFITSGYRLLNVTTEQLEPDGSRKIFSNNLIGIIINDMLLRIWGAQRDKTSETIAKQALERSHQQMRSLAAHLQGIRERERASLAREMHDVLGQSLTSLKIEISWLAKKLHSAADNNTLPALDEKLNEISHLLNETIVSVKSLSTELRPGVLDKFGLAAAIEWQCEEFGRRSGIECEWKVPEEEFSITPERSTALFRIMQEALTNVARHSGATAVEIDLTVTDTQCNLIIKDNGRGITNEEMEAPDSLGLLGMRERTEFLGGTFSVSGSPDKGTAIVIHLPVAERASKTEQPHD